MNLTIFLLQAILAASKDSEEIYSFSKETMWMAKGNSSQGAFFFPASYILILASGTPLLNLDLG